MKSVFVIAIIMAASATTSVQAQAVFKCSVNGVVTYQQDPCAGMPVTREMMQAAAPAPATQVTTQVAKSSRIEKSYADKAMQEAYLSHMARGEYAIAKSFASTDAQRNQAIQREEAKKVQCQTMAVRVREAESNNKHRNGAWQHAAESAQAQYSIKCGS
jgi:hypothetical protein